MADLETTNLAGFSDLVDLTAEEQNEVFKRLDSQCREHEGKSCEELLKEAEEKMREDMN